MSPNVTRSMEEGKLTTKSYIKIQIIVGNFVNKSE